MKATFTVILTLVLGICFATTGWAQFTDQQNPEEYTQFEGKRLEIPGLGLKLFSAWHVGETTGFNADGTAVAANCFMNFGESEPRYRLMGYEDDRFVFLPGGGRSLDNYETAWGVSLIAGNPPRASMIGQCSHGGLCAATWTDFEPFVWTNGIGILHEHFHVQAPVPSLFYGEIMPRTYFGKINGLAYVGNGLDLTSYPKFGGCYRGTEFGTGLVVGTYREAGTSEGVFVDSLASPLRFIPDAFEAIDVATIDNLDQFGNVGALIVGRRMDGKPAAWEVTREGEFENLRFSGRDLVAETNLLYPMKGAPFYLDWKYTPTAVSPDGMVIVGYAEPDASGAECYHPLGPLAVMWIVTPSLEGRLVVSEALPIGTPAYTKRGFAIEMRWGMIKANDVYFDAENQVYVISGRDHNGHISIGTIPVERLPF